MILFERPTFSTIRQYNKSFTNNSATIYINDKKLLEANGDIMRPVGTAMS